MDDTLDLFNLLSDECLQRQDAYEDETSNGILVEPVPAQEAERYALEIAAGQLAFLDLTEPWKAEWQDMPDYTHADLAPKFQVIINFSCAADLEDFGKLLGQSLQARTNTKQLQSLWHPEQEIGRMTNKRYIEEPS